jgi:N-acetylglucosamine kinase-like BadF-type ATPase
MMRAYLGVDGGQSSTIALIANETGRVIGRGSGGPCNHVGSSEGRSRFFSAIGACLAEACRDAGLNFESVTFATACLGFSGGAEDKDAYARELIRSQRYKITHDAEIALTGALAAAPGIIVIAGTGSIAFGRNGAGRTARAGGWGYVLGDEGGGFDIVRRALRAALQYEEGWGPETSLRDLLTGAVGASSANNALHRFYADISKTQFAALARIVDQAAVRGDPIAKSILTDAGDELARYAEGVHRNLFGNGEMVAIARVGGVFRSETLCERFAYGVQKRIGCPITAPMFSPAAGALLEAMRLDGNTSSLSDVPESEK